MEELPPDQPKETPAAPVRRSLFRRALRWVFLSLLVLLLLLAIFHRPLVFWAARWGAIHYAARENLALDFQIGGSLYRDVSLEKISARATGPSALRELTVESVELRYSLGDWLRKGPSELLKSVAVREASAILDPFQAPPARAASGKGTGNLPSILPKELEVRGASLTVKAPSGDWGLSNALLTLYPDRPGMLAIEKLVLPTPPGRVLDGLAAQTFWSVRAKNNGGSAQWLFGLREFGIGPDLQIRELNLDLTHAGRGRLELTAITQLFRGEARLKATLAQSAGQSNADLRVSGTGFSLESAGSLAGIADLSGTVGALKCRVVGDLNRPASLTGAASLVASGLRWKNAGIDRAGANLELRQGQAILEADLARGTSAARLRAVGKLPAQPGPIQEAHGDYQLNVPSLGELSPDLALPPQLGQLAGEAYANGDFELKNSRLRGELKASGTGVSLGGRHLDWLSLQANATKPWPTTAAAATGTSGAQPEGRGLPELFKGLEAKAAVQLGALDSEGYGVDGGLAELALTGSLLQIQKSMVQRGPDHLVLSGSYWLPESSQALGQGKLELDLDLEAPHLEAISSRLEGALSIQGKLARANQVIAGNLSLAGSALRFQEFAADSLAGQVSIADNKARVEQLRLDLGNGDFASATGEVFLAGDYAYRGTMEAKVRDLSLFQPLLRSAGRNEPLSGSLDLSWSGSGQRSWDGHSGELNLRLAQGKFGAIQPIEAAVSGTYSGKSIQFPWVHLSAGKTSLGGSLYYENAFLSAQNLALRQGELVALAGNAFVPLDLRRLSDPAGPVAAIPAGGVIAIDLYSRQLDLKQLASALGQTAPAWLQGGQVSASLQARGTLEAMKAAFLLQGRELKTSDKLSPGKLDLAVNLVDSRATLKAQIAQPEFKPLLVQGDIPFDLRKALADKQLDPDSPLRLKASLERSPLGPLAKTIPDIRYVEGEISLDASAAGTIRQPVFAGAAQFNVPALRFQQATMPSVANFRSRLAFQKNRLEIERCEGEVGGGPFKVRGGASFASLTQPVLDVRATAKNFLVERNNSLTVRANADVTLQGPIQSGTVRGTIGITNSRFFRQVDILPIGLPGRPTKRAPQIAPQLILPPALADWSFDLRIRTDDPFRVRSNLAHGEGIVDLAFRGKGKKPGLDGQVSIQNFAATLPFSTLNVETGAIYFSPSTGLNPKLDIRGTSELREYHIDVYIHGSAQDPQTTFTSDPPLPQEDIVALLATGATVKEIGGNPDVLAGRAAVLLFDKLYQKIFKKSAPGANESVSSRLRFDIGGVNATTGKQELSTQFKLTDNFYLIGEVGIEGQVGGKIKYVMRFR